MEVQPISNSRRRWMAVELVDPRRALEVVPRNLSLPCRDRWLELVVINPNPNPNPSFFLP